MSSVFDDNPVAQFFLNHPLAVSWLLHPVPDTALLAEALRNGGNTYCIDGTASVTPNVSKQRQSAAAAPSTSLVVPPASMLRGLDPAREIATVCAYHHVEDGLGFGSLHDVVRDGEAEYFGRDGATRRMVSSLVNHSSVQFARFPDGLVILKTFNCEFRGEEMEPVFVIRSYVFDGFPKSEANGGRFPKLLLSVKASQMRMCPFCTANGVVCDCPAAYKKEFLPSFGEIQPTLSSFIQVGLAINHQTMFSRFKVFTAGSQPMDFEAFHKISVSGDRAKVSAFIRKNLQREATLMGLMGAPRSSPLQRLDQGPVALMKNGGDPPHDGLNVLHSCVENPLQFFMALRIAHKHYFPWVIESTPDSSTSTLEFQAQNKDALAFNDSSLPLVNLSSPSGLPAKHAPNSSFTTPNSPLFRATPNANANSSSTRHQLSAPAPARPARLGEPRAAASSATEAQRSSCDSCGKFFTRLSDLRRHMRTVHEDGPRTFQCEICHASFKQKWHLNTHVQGIHSGEKPFGCEECELTFARKSDLSKHVRVVHLKVRYCATCHTKHGKEMSCANASLST